MYKSAFTKSFIKDLRRLDKEVQAKVINEFIPKILNEPEIGQHFKGNEFRELQKVAFRYKRNDYRIVYFVEKKIITIQFLAVGSRENFYKKFSK